MSLIDVTLAVAQTLPDVAVRFGAKAINDQRTLPPRVVFKPTLDNWVAGMKTSGAGIALRPWATQREGCDIHIWGAGARADTDPYKDERATQVLVHRVVWAIKQVAPQGHILEQGLWATTPDHGTLGALYVLKAWFLTPVVTPVDERTTIAGAFTDVDSQPTTTLINQDGTDGPSGSPAP